MSTIKLISDDDEIFEIPESFIAGSQAMRYHLEDGAIRTTYKRATLKMVVDYCMKHAEATQNSSGGDDSDDLKEYDAELVKSVKADGSHHDIIFAAGYFKIEGLFVLMCSAWAEMNGTTFDEIHMNFIKDDWNYEEEGYDHFQRIAAARRRWYGSDDSEQEQERSLEKRNDKKVVVEPRWYVSDDSEQEQERGLEKRNDKRKSMKRKSAAVERKRKRIKVAIKAV